MLPVASCQETPGARGPTRHMLRVVDQEAQRGQADAAKPHLGALPSLDSQGLDLLFHQGRSLLYMGLEIINLHTLLSLGPQLMLTILTFNY